jgi:molybdate transport system substrate-binding protein
MLKKPLWFVLAVGLFLSLPMRAEDLTVFHAGSLAKAMGDIAKAFTAETGITVQLVGAGSGSLRQRIEKGERPDLFASADMENPRALASKGLAQDPTTFARNIQCLLAKKDLHVTADNCIDKMLDPKIKLGTSTPILDPGGDYAWKLFDLIGTQRPGAADKLKAKAIKLVGDPALPMPPKEYTKYQVSWHFEEGRAELFPSYVTSAKIVASELDWVEIIMLPPSLTVSAEYGLTTVNGAKPQAAQLMAYILSPKGQAILQGYGFTAP